MTDVIDIDLELDAVKRLSRDLKKASATMSLQEIRYLVDGYYMLQEYRKAAGNQLRALTKSGEPHEVLQWLFAQAETLEEQIKKSLDSWTKGQDVGQWLQSIVGIGPVLAAGLMAHTMPGMGAEGYSASNLFRFAGLDPTCKWEKGQKRPWNARLKTLCWLMGDSFVKQSARENAVYGQLYYKRKFYEEKKNFNGDYADQAQVSLTTKKFDKDSDAVLWYSGAFDPRVVQFVRDLGMQWNPQLARKVTNAALENKEVRDEKLTAVYAFADSLGGLKGVQMLPPARIHLRCIRWTVSIFLDHYYMVARTCLGLPSKVPYVIAKLGHSDRIAIPNFDMKRLIPMP